MAEELDDGEFWLPSQFLTDDDILMDFAEYAGVDKKAAHHHQLGKKDAFDGFESSRLGFGFGSGSTGPNSDLSSPVESVNGSTETESDEDAELLLLSGLTRQMARSTLEDSFNKGSALSSSPQSTLWTFGRDIVGVGGGSGGSSRGSPTGTMSPPKLPSKEDNQNDGALNVLCAAVGEVARMRKMRTEEGTGFFDSSKREALLSGSSVARKPSHISPVPIGTNHPRGFYPPQPISQQQSQIQQKQMMNHIWGQPKPQLKPQYPQFGQNTREFADGGRNNLSPSAWPPLQLWNQQRHNQQPQQRPVPMRPAFLGNPGLKNGPKRESAGTGVFLPRRVGGPNPLRKKPEVPMRFSTGNGNGNGSQRKNKSNRAQAGDTVAAGKTDYGIQLPQEWTY